MIKKILARIKNFLPEFEKLQKIFENFVPYILPENWVNHKKSFALFWIISSFTIIFIVWASIANVNQVVKAAGTVIPDSKVHVIQSKLDGPIEKMNVSLGDKVSIGDILFLVDHKNIKKLLKISSSEVETRKRKVEILNELVSKGSDSEFRLLDEKLALLDAEKRNDLTRREFEFTEVKAPVSGIVSRVEVINLGQFVATGNLLAEIVPENDKLKVEAGVLPKDIAFVKIGQKAKVGFSAFDASIYGTVEGTVTKVAASTTEKNENLFYQIIIEIDDEELMSSAKIKLQSGMVTDVSIIGQERSVISYLLNPITKLSQKALRE